MNLNLLNNGIAQMAATQLGHNTKAQARTMARISSGNQHAHPNHDAGGLAVTMKLNSTHTRTKRVLENAGNALSFLQVQHGAMKHVGELLDRMTVLKTLALDGTKNAGDLANYQSEFSELQKEAAAALDLKFNGISLFTNTFADLYLPLSESGMSDATTFPQEQVDLITNIQADPMQFQQDTISGLAGSDPEAQVDTLQGFAGDSTAAQVDTVSGLRGSPAVAQVDTLRGLVGSPEVAQIDTISGIAGDDTETFHVETVSVASGVGAVAQVDRVRGLVGDGSFFAQTDTISGLTGGPLDTYTISIGVDSVTVPWRDDVGTTLDDIVVAVAADANLSSVVNAVRVGNTVELNGKVMGASFTANVTSSGGGITSTTTTPAATPDVMRVTIDGVAIQTDWLLDAPTTAGNLISNINGDATLSAVLEATLDGGDILLTAKTPGTGFSTSVNTVDNGQTPTAAINVQTETANVVADTFSVDIDGTEVTAAWDTDAGTTAQALALAINSNATLSAKVNAVASGGDIVVTGKTLGEQFATTASKTGSGVISSTTTTEGFVKDTFRVTIDGVAVDVEFDTDAGTTADRIAGAINANGALAPKVSAARAGNNVEITSKSPGVAFTSSVALSDNGNGPTAAMSVATTTANAVADTFDIDVDGTQLNVVWNTDAATTAQAIVDALNGNAAISAKLEAKLSGTDVVLESKVAGSPFVTTVTANDNGAGTTAALNKEATTPNAVDDNFEIEINGTTVSLDWDQDTATTTAGLVTAINNHATLGGIVEAVATADGLTLTAKTPGTPFTATARTTDNSSGTTAAMNLATTSPNLVGDTFDITVDGNTIQSKFTNDAATTAQFMADDINANPGAAAVVTAAAVGSTVTLTAKTPGIPFTTTAQANENGGAVGANIALSTTEPNMPGDTFDVTVDTHSLNVAWDTDAATTAKAIADSVNTNAAFSSIVVAEAIGDRLTLTVLDGRNDFTAAIAPVEDGFQEQAAASSSSTTEPLGDQLRVGIDGSTITVDVDRDMTVTASALADAINLNLASKNALAEADGSDLKLTARVPGVPYSATIEGIDGPMGNTVAGGTVTPVQSNLGFDENGSVVVSISRHDIFLSGPGNGLQNMDNQSLLDASHSMDRFSLDDFERFTNTLSISLSENGSLQERIRHNINLLSYNRAHIDQARSRLEDINLAAEQTALARWNLLVEGLPSLMAQANALPGLALQLVL